jgi:hypothetical protein
MIAVPKLILIALLGFVVWQAMRWLNRPAASPRVPNRRAASPAPPQATVEDLTACRVCGAYVAAGARGCGKPGCPQPL